MAFIPCPSNLAVQEQHASEAWIQPSPDMPRAVVDHHLATNLVELSDTGGLTFNLGSQNVQLRGGSFAGAPGQSVYRLHVC